MELQDTDIEEVELELTGTCNLDCPLCARNYKEAKPLIKYNERDVSLIIEQLNTYPNLKNVCIAGIISEPTLYKQLFLLMEYLVHREVEVELYSNADTHNEKYWEKLGKICTEKVKVYFTVCGSTQEMHSLYRVGSSLERVLRHHQAFKRGNRSCSDYLQHITFNYNKDDFKNMGEIRKTFSNEWNINSLPYNERFKVDSNIMMTDELSNTYKNIANIGKIRFGKDAIIRCKSLEKKFVAIDQFGKITPCFLYRLYSPDKFEKNYDLINKYTYDFCYECESLSCKMLEKNNLERMA